MRGRKRHVLLATGLLVMLAGSTAAVADSGNAPPAAAKSYAKIDKTAKNYDEISKTDKRYVKLDKSSKNFTKLSKGVV